MTTFESLVAGVVGVAVGLAIPFMKLVKIFQRDKTDLTKAAVEESLYSMLSQELKDAREDNDTLRHRIQEKNRKITSLEISLHDLERTQADSLSSLDECQQERKKLRERVTEYEHSQTVIGFKSHKYPD